MTAHAEGNYTVASGYQGMHAEGTLSKPRGRQHMVEGSTTTGHGGSWVSDDGGRTWEPCYQTRWERWLTEQGRRLMRWGRPKPDSDRRRTPGRTLI